MPVQVSYPGVYIQEVSSGTRTIAGVPTSVAAFVGYTTRGPVNEPKQIFSYADFERAFGGLSADSDLSYAVNHFYLNGGGTAWIVRVAENAAAASVDLQTIGGTTTLTAEAASEGAWGNLLVLSVDHDTSQPASTFNLTVQEMTEQNGRLVVSRSETHRNLTTNDQAPTYVVDTVNAASDLVRLSDGGVAGTQAGTSTSGPLVDGDATGLTDDTRRLAISLDGGPVHEFSLFPEGNNTFATLEDLRAAIETTVQGLDATPAFTGFAVQVVSGRLVATSGSAGRNSVVTFRNASSQNAAAALSLGQVNGGREVAGAAETRPASTGTTGGRIADFSTVALADNDPVTAELVDILNPGTPINSHTVNLTPVPATLSEARSQIEAGLRASTNPAFAGATVSIVDDALVVSAGGTGYNLGLTFSGAGATALLLDGGGEFTNVTAYQPGAGPTVAAQVAGLLGADGTPPAGTTQIVGSRADKTGFHALEDVRSVNIINLPGISDVSALSQLIAYAEERRAMVLVDIDPNVNTMAEARDWMNDAANSSLKHPNAVAYFPRLRLADPLLNNRLRNFANAGTMAGLWALTDGRRGVWKAPAGIEARLRGTQGLDYALTDPENGQLNPLGLNCIRAFPVYGIVSWGARTLVGADALTSEWKYLSVRRTALFIEESLYRGTQFVVFEPNDEPLWAEIRLAVGTFMNNLFRQGAFQGSSPDDAYFVRCDSSTTTQADIDLGIVNIQVGFAPLKPAEFVVIQIQQLAGQSAS